MMVEHDDVHAKRARLAERRVACRTAVDRDQQLRAAGGEATDRLNVRPVALEDSVRNVDLERRSRRTKERAQNRGRGRTVDVVIAEDRDLLLAFDRLGDSRGRLLHVGQAIGFRQERSDAGGDILGGAIHSHATSGEDAREKVRHAVPLGDRQGPHPPRFV